MTSFLKNDSQCGELIRLWKTQLQVEEALQKTLSPVSPEVARNEGRPYFKLPLPGKEQSDLASFLLRESNEYQLDIRREQLPFVKHLHQLDRLKRRYRQEIEHEFLIGFPAFFFINKFGQEKLSTLFKIPLAKIDYPENIEPPLHSSQISYLPEVGSLNLLLEEHADDDMGLAYWIDEFLLQEELEIADEEILAFRREWIEKKHASSDFLIQFCRKLFTVDSAKAKEQVFEYVTRSLHAHVRTVRNFPENRQAIAVYPYAIVYELEDNQPTRQLQIDLDSIVDRELIDHLPKRHPARFYLFGNNNEEGYAQSILGQYRDLQLTESQAKAVQAVSERKLSTINGPPGTGKTHIIRNIAADRFVRYAMDIASTDRTVESLESVTLITSTNNRAVDNALEGMEIDGLLPICIRMGSRIVLSRTTVDFLRQYCKKLSKRRGHGSFRDFFKFKKKLRSVLVENRDDGKNASQTRYETYLLARKMLDAWAGANREELLKLLRSTITDIVERRGLRSLKSRKSRKLFFSAFPIVGSTLLSIRNLFSLSENSIGMVIVDEAGQCLPSYILPALIRARQAAMIGDTLQLEPIAKLRADDIETLKRKRKIDLSPESIRFFSSSAEIPRSSHHIAIAASSSVQQLREHFRCQIPIIRICMELCEYDLNVRTEKNAIRGNGGHLLYADVSGDEMRYGGSWANEAEVGKLAGIVGRLKDWGVEYGEIAILTPYRGQLSLINRALKRSELAYTGSETDLDSSNAITTGTVHRFQGGEKKVVIFSHVIANGIPVFLNSRVNLLNVAISRAKDLFVFVGSVDALGRGTYTARLREHLLKYGGPFDW